ncbi:GAF and ANTAR domain-containing protein [Actinomycetospora soli]|uniref:GAF and ANTAR domain-containing protein n=1 Tax=Actinomycetospora soli TaxID=2893887 RepID=UPI001E3930E3|nr:GAF and ANTAR domain-containing protein [Actinomycetospora soli]MCD2187325.1 GAF and ANTAR domain-containing protein [Actinomycetospora soli]
MEQHEVDALSEALSHAATSVLRAPTPDQGLGTTEEVLTRIVEVAAQRVPGADGAGITQTDRGKVTSRAPSSDWVADLDAAQAELDEGPCVDAGHRDEPTHVEAIDLDDETRWPRWRPRARAAGVRAMLSYAMGPPDAPVGSLNLYSFTPGAFSEAGRVTLEVFALQAAIALYGASRAEGLDIALGNRDQIGQAKGILMERHGVDGERAFRMLVEASQQSNIKLRDVAGWLLEEHRRRSDEGTGS